MTFEQFHAAVNHVAPSLIRVQADEATYNLHIIIRFELERDLLTGDLAVADLPAAWNQKYREALGVTPRNDAEGCLQDIHWSAGLLVIFRRIRWEISTRHSSMPRHRPIWVAWMTAFARGDFSGLLGWLRRRSTARVSDIRPAPLIEHITGSRPDHRPLIEGLRRKYGELYGI